MAVIAELVKVIVSQPLSWPITFVVVMLALGYLIGKLADLVEAWRKSF